MPKQHILALDYIRGLSMLGVLGIHTGAYSLAYPAVNPHLFALLEIFTRFSVPIFFFVSAFGLFISQPLKAEFSYLAFMRRRFKAVLLPYLAWSLLYMLHYTWASGDFSIWNRPLVYEYFLFGLASYQLYFLVILVGFYALMPLWRQLVRCILKAPLAGLLSLLIGQIAFNYYSSYLLTAGFDNYYLNLAIQHRMSYLVLHYLFIFILGAVCSELYPQFLAALERNKRVVNVSFVATLTGMLFFYYHLVYFKQYSLEQAVNTVHQLSPVGVLYTLGATLFWFKTFSRPLPTKLSAALGCLGRYSYLVYLVHPLVMYYLIVELTRMAIPLTPTVTVAFYFATLALSTCLASIITMIGTLVPLLSLALTGSLPKQETIRQKA
ncbi:acyltransferase [Sporomusa malonica]|uniref:Surface polysaccharide O-acyltransferase, integral membrane enzyme n=1 Tax=Sporomusa malonica TaxID=112901 RepID=A0A1W2BQH5_9FIRM|nr:acyltransferase [Sporomusa malonica]SMC75209.1 Surface polysaccharide O-acyltransferase, integral membrane enzyme [Sporomusa malonica]